MKVIQIMDNFIVGGGVNSFVYDLCYVLKEQGCDVSLIGILSLGYEDNPIINQMRSEGIRVECIGASSKKDAIMHYVGNLKGCIKNISAGEQTICNLHLKLGVLMGVLATQGLKNVKCVETYHNTYHHYHLQCWTLRPFIKKYICVSETARQEMRRRFHTPGKDTVAIPNGVSRKRIRQMAGIDQLETSTDGSIHIVSVGRLSYEKNFMLPVKAFVDICNENITYTLVGGGPQEEEIRKAAEKNQYIEMLGAQSRERALQELAKADIVVMPSLWEGRSILQLEAMALDKPMILSDVPGLREPYGESSLKDGELFRICKFGYLVRTNDVESYQKALEDFTMTKSRDMGEYVKKISEENDMTILANRYIQVYKILDRY